MRPTARWPAVGPGTVSGMVAGAPGETWKAINHALALGLAGCRLTRRWRSCWPSTGVQPLPDMGPKVLAEKIWAWEQEQFPVRGRRRRTVARQLGTAAVDHQNPGVGRCLS